MLLGGGGLLGTLDGAVPVGVVELPGTQGFATVVEVPLGVVLVPATVELPLPAVDGVLPVVVEVVELPVLVEGVVPLAVVPLLEGVHGATVVEVPVEVPVVEAP